MSEDSKLIVVVGVTGNQGGSIARVFHNLEPTWRIRGITRNPSKPGLDTLRALGVELVAGDLDYIDTLEAAFSGASAIFGVTDFWQFPKDPAAHKLAEKDGISLNEACMHLEVAQAKNIVDAAAKVYEREGKLERFVWSSLSDSNKWSKGAITWNYHFDGKARVTEYIKEKHRDGLATVTSYLQVGLYMDNWSSGAIRPKKQPNGNFVFRLPSAQSPKPAPWVHPPNDTGHFVRALILSPRSPPGTTLLGVSTPLTMSDWCILWTRVLRARKLITPTTVCEFDGSMKVEQCEEFGIGQFGRELAEMFVYNATWGYDGGDPEVKRPQECGVEVERLLQLEKYMWETDWSEML